MQTDTTLLEVVVAKSLSAFKLYAATHNKMQQGVQTDATCKTQKRRVRLHEV